MSSAQISEQETRTALPVSEPRKALPEPEEPKRGGFRKWIIALLILAAVAGAVWKIRKNTAEQNAQNQRMNVFGGQAIPVQIAAVEQRTMPIYLTELGTVTAYYTVTIKSRVDGQLIAVHVREGEKVHKGQLLAEIDPAPYQAALAQAQGQLVKDEAASANALAEAERYKALYQAGVVSKENEQAQVATAGQMQGSIAADKAAIQAAKVNVDYAKITSPIDGVVGLRQVDPGNIVHASDTNGLLVVTQLQPISVIFTLPEDQLPQVLDLMRGGKKLTVDAYDRAGTTHLATGTVLTVDNQIDTTTGTVKVKAIFDNKDGALFPNQFVNIRLILQQRPNALVVPAAAVQTGSQGPFVYVVQPGDPPAELAGDTQPHGVPGGGRVHTGASPGANVPAGAGGGAMQNQPHFHVIATPVKVDLTEGQLVILGGGVNPGDKIVIDGQERLKNGSRVTIAHPAGSGNGPNGPRGQRGANGGNGAFAPGVPGANGANPAGSQTGQQGQQEQGRQGHAGGTQR